MGTKVTISPFDSVDNSSFITELNAAIDTLSDEFDKVTYRDGSFDMSGNLDMGSARIFNLPYPGSNTEPLRLQDAQALAGVEQPNFTFAVSSLAPGSTPTINVTGTYPDYAFTFGLVRGDTGASGALSDGTFGGIVVSGSGTNLSVVAEHITLARMAQLPANTIIGNDTAGSAVPQALSIAEVQTMIGLSAYAPLASPPLTGVPTAPTAAPGTNTTQLATTAFVTAADAVVSDSITTAVNAQHTANVRTIPVLATSMMSRLTSGAASGTQTETATNKVNFRTLDFDQSTTEYAQVHIPMPKGWDEGTVSVQFIWRTTALGSVVWGVRGASLSDDDLLDATFGTSVTVTDAVTATTDLMQSAYSGPVTIGGTPAAEDLVCFEIFRDASNGSDTVAADAKLVAVRIKYTTNAKDDS